ncbi:hypothetical protein WMF37_49105 [Sorangium sp. So ce291]|uniref:hypothetical protein n=1 Tax=Sorangium sp. So ce291 TaxID=3133294 RepID=UPI003F6125AC
MKMYPESVVGVGGAKYRARIRIDNPDEIYEFEFVVEGDDVRVVVWSSDFVTFVRGNVGAGRYLMEAILALDRSQGADISEIQ